MTAENQELAIALNAVVTASRLCARVQSRLDEVVSLTKQDRSPVTVADYAAQAAVCRILGQIFPGDGMIAEEHSADLLGSSGGELSAALVETIRDGFDSSADLGAVCSWLEYGRNGRGERSWILDPVDGTKGFLRGGQYAVALALSVNGVLEIAALGCPNLACGSCSGTVLLAARGRGAWQVPLDDPGAREPISVSGGEEGERLVFVESVESGHSDHGTQSRIVSLLGASGEPLRMDSQAKYAAVARGDASVYLRLPNPGTPDYRQKIWDHAAGALIVSEAGGRVTDISGSELDFTAGSRLEHNRGVVATNGACHDRVIEAVGQALSREKER